MRVGCWAYNAFALAQQRLFAGKRSAAATLATPETHNGSCYEPLRDTQGTPQQAGLINEFICYKRALARVRGALRGWPLTPQGVFHYLNNA